MNDNKDTTVFSDIPKPLYYLSPYQYNEKSCILNDLKLIQFFSINIRLSIMKKKIIEKIEN